MIPFDSYEIHVVHEFNEDGRKFCEQVANDQAAFWTLFGHIPGEGVMAIGDFATREEAEEAFQRITGISFGSHEEMATRVRVMQAGPRLLEALENLVIGVGMGWDLDGMVEVAKAAIAEVTGRAGPAHLNLRESTEGTQHIGLV